MQRRHLIAVVCGVSLLMAGCLPLRRSIEPRYTSLKDDAPAAASTAAPRTTALPAPQPPPAPVAAPSPPAKPRGTQDITADDRSRDEQLARCAQRHVDYQAGRLNESAEQKQVRDEICAALHRGDHARKEGR